MVERRGFTISDVTAQIVHTLNLILRRHMRFNSLRRDPMRSTRKETVRVAVSEIAGA